MLSVSKIRTAQEIAKILADEGMIFGQDLESYVNVEEFHRHINFKSEEQREVFIDYLFSYIEKIWEKIIVVHNHKNNTYKMFKEIKEAANFLEVEPNYISVSKFQKTKIKNTYSISNYNYKIADLYEGIDSIQARWNI